MKELVMKSLFWSLVMFFLVTVVPCFAKGKGGGGSRHRGHMPTLPVEPVSTFDEFIQWSLGLILDIGMIIIVIVFWGVIAMGIWYGFKYLVKKLR